MFLGAVVAEISYPERCRVLG